MSVFADPADPRDPANSLQTGPNPQGLAFHGSLQTVECWRDQLVLD
jgi:hypothetical protein